MTAPLPHSVRNTPKVARATGARTCARGQLARNGRLVKGKFMKTIIGLFVMSLGGYILVIKFDFDLIVVFAIILIAVGATWLDK